MKPGLLLFILILTGCENNSGTDGRNHVVMWDSSCKAYSVNHHMGDAYFIAPMPELDALCPGAKAK